MRWYAILALLWTGKSRSVTSFPYCYARMKFGKLILRKIVNIVATRCLILKLKCTKFDFGWGSAPDHAGKAYSTPPDPLAGFKVACLYGRKGRKDRREGHGRR